MPDGSEAYQVEVKANIDGKERYVTRLTAVIALGARFWPTIELITHDPKDAYTKAEKLATEDVAKFMGSRQNKMFSERSNADAEITVNVKNDPDAGSFSFKGFISGTAYSFGPYNVQLADHCIPEYAQIESLSYAIYSARIDHLLNQADPNLDKSETIENFINALQKHMRETYDPTSNPKADDSKYTIAQHNINEKFAKYFEELLSNSKGEDKFGWTEVVNILYKYDTNLRNVILTTLAQQTGPFASVIDKLAEKFMCVYVPSWDNIGKFVNKYNLFNNEEELELVICGITIDTSSGFGLMPTGFVGVNSPYLLPGTLAGKPAKQFVVYPKENAENGKGIMYQSLGPAWISEACHTEELKSAAARREKGVNVVEAQQIVQDTKKQDEKAVKQNLTVLELWAKAQYAHLALSKSGVSVQCPLSFAPTVGKFYSVRAKGGAQLFKGVLRKITHSISTEGNNPQAYTTLDFAYVQMSGFSLPGL